MSLPLVLSTTQLHQHLTQLETDGMSLSDARICLVDLRSAEAYAAGHLKGAVNANPAILNRSEPPIGGLMPTPEAVNQFLHAIGARLGDQIIAYDVGLETPAARLMWVLDAYGYGVGSWLSGGYKAWSDAGLPTTTENVVATPGDLTLSYIGDNVVSVDDLVKELSSPETNSNMKVLDVRSAGEYQGTDVRAVHAGHVPGARHAEWTTMLNANGELRDDASLQAQLDELGIAQENNVIVYCQTHQRSAVTYVALKHLGYENVRAIDGAWSAWGNRDDTPKASVSQEQTILDEG